MTCLRAGRKDIDMHCDEHGTIDYCPECVKEESEESSKSTSTGLLGTLIVRFDGNINSIDIESKGHFYYSNIEGMYKTGAGFGLQTNHIDIEEEIKQLCHKISDAIYDFTGTKSV